MQLTDPVTGGQTRVYLFVGCLPISRYSFVEPTLDMCQDTWLRAHVAMFDWFGGSVPRIVPDYAPRHIIGLMCPGGLCAGGAVVVAVEGRGYRFGGT